MTRRLARKKYILIYFKMSLQTTRVKIRHVKPGPRVSSPNFSGPKCRVPYIKIVGFEKLDNIIAQLHSF